MSSSHPTAESAPSSVLLQYFPSTSHPFQHLASIEIQLIMHYLPCSDLLRFSRVTRRLRVDASHAYGWRYTEWRVRFEEHSQSKIGDRIQTCMLRYCPTSVTWLPPNNESPFSLHRGPDYRSYVGVSEITAIHRIPNLTAFTSSRGGVMSEEQWTSLITDQAFSHVRTLNIEHLAQLPLNYLPPLQSLTHLTTLHISSIYASSTREIGKLRFLQDAWDNLKYIAPNLTDLRVQDSTAGTKSRTFVISELTQLRTLHLVQPQLQAKRFRAFLTSENMKRLEHLKLNDLSVDSVLLNDMTETFREMKQLRSISLVGISWIDRILSGLAHAPSLHELKILSLTEMVHLPNARKVKELLDLTTQNPLMIELSAPAAPGSAGRTDAVQTKLDLEQYTKLDPHRVRAYAV